MKIIIVGGARPNFMKISPLIHAFKKHPEFDIKLLHTGQHYDYEMSEAFFQDLDLPKPDFFLNTGSGSHAEQTAKIMIAFEKICLEEKPDMVLVVGDVNSTLACTIVAKKCLLKVAHVEAGLRSFDFTMPEEINRLVTDAISDYLFVTEKSGLTHLQKEGKAKDKVFFVGNVMIDTLLQQLKKLKTIDPTSFPSHTYKNQFSRYGVITLHRPSNVDCADTLTRIFHSFDKISRKIPLIFPIHPRTSRRMEELGIHKPAQIISTQPLGYLEFLNLWKDAALVITDSGGIQEETTALKVPCLTIRDNTERPITISEGTNTLIHSDFQLLEEKVSDIIDNRYKKGKIPKFWDGKSAERIAEILIKVMQ